MTPLPNLMQRALSRVQPADFIEVGKPTPEPFALCRAIQDRRALRAIATVHALTPEQKRRLRGAGERVRRAFNLSQ